MLFRSVHELEESFQKEIREIVDVKNQEIKTFIENNNILFQKVPQILVYLDTLLTFNRLFVCVLLKIVGFQEAQSSMLMKHYQEQLVIIKQIVFCFLFFKFCFRFVFVF